jgi:hypothetical protein
MNADNRLAPGEEHEDCVGAQLTIYMWEPLKPPTGGEVVKMRITIITY